jgi:uncharacterized protein YbgA (DUF1722 family)/uncharacterized protein YbbK (DUF523 family)
MEDAVRLGISSCLLGQHVRYDGGHKLDPFLKDTLGKFVEWVPVCPEVEMGLPVPREAMRLVGTAGSPRLVTVATGVDHTARMTAWTRKRLDELEGMGLCGFVFKSRSPSSGMRGVKIYGASGVPARTGVGMFARAFMERFPHLPAEDDGRLHDPGLRENFIERVFTYKRWVKALGPGSTVRDLIAFHTDHKLLILAHSRKHYSLLGGLVAKPKEEPFDALRDRYLAALMAALSLLATARKNADVLQHIMGYFKRQLSADEKRELLDVVADYRNGLIPLIVPVVLLNHYVRKFDEPYLRRQYYLHPHPLELMLRNHV